MRWNRNNSMRTGFRSKIPTLLVLKCFMRRNSELDDSDYVYSNDMVILFVVVKIIIANWELDDFDLFWKIWWGEINYGIPIRTVFLAMSRNRNNDEKVLSVVQYGRSLFKIFLDCIEAKLNLWVAYRKMAAILDQIEPTHVCVISSHTRPTIAFLKSPIFRCITTSPNYFLFRFYLGACCNWQCRSSELY